MTHRIDVRRPIGLLWIVIGVLLAAYGVLSHREGSRSLALDRLWGCVMLIFGILMLATAAAAERVDLARLAGEDAVVSTRGTRVVYSAAILPAAAALLWMGLLTAAHEFPTEFDWRYMTVSVLLSPKDNPTVRHWASAGIGLCGLAILIWTFVVGRSGSAETPAGRNRPHGVYWLRWGGACMVGSGVLPFHLLGLPKTHEWLTLLAFLGLCLGAVRLAIDWVHELDLPSQRSSVVGALVSSVLIAPIVLAGLAQLYVFYVLPQLHWVGIAWRARGVPVYLSFAFWEWVTFVLLTVYLAGLGAVVRGPASRR